eukprot:gene30348-37922_t
MYIRFFANKAEFLEVVEEPTALFGLYAPLFVAAEEETDPFDAMKETSYLFCGCTGRIARTSEFISADFDTCLSDARAA